MKKICCFLIMVFTVLLIFTTEVYAANDDYMSFNEIMLSNGKLLCYFTDEEFDKYYQEISKRKFTGINYYVVNSNVSASYISSTLYNIDNTGKTDINYQFDVEVETEKKISWKVSGDLSAAASGTIKMFKGQLESKLGIDYSDVTATSKKETQKLDITVESNSRAIIYLMGNARVTNGVCAIYIVFIQTAKFGFEYFTILNQYPRIEKRAL